MNLKEKLSSKYLTTKDYFDLSAKFLKQYAKEEKKRLICIAVLLNVLIAVLFSFNNMLSLLILLSELLVILFVGKDIIQKIEKEKCNSIFKIFLRVTNLSIIPIFILVLLYAASFLIFITRLPDISTVGVLVLGVLFIFIGYLFLIILYFATIPYFNEMYLYRNISFIEALKYTKYISKGHRLRKLKVEVMFLIGSLMITPITGIISLIMPNIILSIIAINVSLIITIYHTTLSLITYLNVEYMDLKILNPPENIRKDGFLMRSTTIDDIEKVLEIIEDAKKTIKELGIDQWQNGYPNRDVIENDIKDEKSFVLEKDGNILGTVVVAFEKENSYENITEGQWLTDGYYFVIHRLAVDTNYKNNGIATKILELIEEKIKNTNIKSIKVDTHEGNIPMRKFLEKNGFIQCGVIYLENCQENDSKRIAYEKIIN